MTGSKPGEPGALGGRETPTNSLADEFPLFRQHPEFNLEPPIPKRLIVSQYADHRCVGDKTLPGRIGIHGRELQLPVRNAEAAEVIAQIHNAHVAERWRLSPIGLCAAVEPIEVWTLPRRIQHIGLEASNIEFDRAEARGRQTGPPAAIVLRKRVAK